MVASAGAGAAGETMGSTSPPALGDADIIERLARLRSLLPLMARDLANARRRVATLELENRRLDRRVRELEAAAALADEPAVAAGA
jgi:hypothetical protein